MQLAFTVSSGTYRYFANGEYGNDYEGVCSVNFNGKSAYLFGAKVQGERRVTAKVLLGVYRHLHDLGVTRIVAERVVGRRLPLAQLSGGEWIVDLTNEHIKRAVMRGIQVVEEVTLKKEE